MPPPAAPPRLRLTGYKLYDAPPPEAPPPSPDPSLFDFAAGASADGAYLNTPQGDGLTGSIRFLYG